ncbi:uncharacterized protein LOC113325112 [Papaver somniferum]|uniref:uncharacterized protein LOC113325112 n=1 Tax=Papaver somniferum TaxID=3469 RepID=UPI000E6F75DB|nr:uncharacterized protein LOC113325112 [Papaver somniferum]
MARHPIGGSSSRFRSGSTRSASTRSPTTTPSANEVNWPRGLLNSQGSPLTDGEHTAGHPSVGSQRVSSSDGDDSLSQGTGNQAEGHGWHDAFHQEDNDPGDTNEAPSILTTVGDDEYWNGETRSTRNGDTRE